MIGAAWVLADEGEKAAPITAPMPYLQERQNLLNHRCFSCIFPF